MKKIIFFLLFPLYILSQSSFSGIIKDSSGYPIMGANIIAVNNETQILDGFGISNDNGYFSLNLKKDTEFNIKITFIGYKPIELNISLKDKLTLNSSIRLEKESIKNIDFEKYGLFS